MSRKYNSDPRAIARRQLNDCLKKIDDLANLYRNRLAQGAGNNELDKLTAEWNAAKREAEGFRRALTLDGIGGKKR